jgi:hypothetical protein
MADQENNQASEDTTEAVLQRWYGEVQFREEGQAVVALVSDQGEERLAQCSPEILAMLDRKGCGEVGCEFVFEMRRRGEEEIKVVESRVAQPMSRAEQGEYWDYLGELLGDLDLSQDEW